jgi:hypothetical protein
MVYFHTCLGLIPYTLLSLTGHGEGGEEGAMSRLRGWRQGRVSKRLATTAARRGGGDTQLVGPWRLSRVAMTGLGAASGGREDRSPEDGGRGRPEDGEAIADIEALSI